MRQNNIYPQFQTGFSPDYQFVIAQCCRGIDSGDNNKILIFFIPGFQYRADLAVEFFSRQHFLNRQERTFSGVFLVVEEHTRRAGPD